MTKINIISSLCVLVLVTLLFNACKSDDPKPSYPKNISVTYKVSGTGLSKVESLRYTNATGGSTSLVDSTIPFSVSFNRTITAGNDLVISVSHSNSAAATPVKLTLEIYVDNVLVKTETYEGAGRVSGSVVYIFV